MNSVLQIGQKIHFLYKGVLWWTGDKNSILKAKNPELEDKVKANLSFYREELEKEIDLENRVH
jgi:hypothetical protein